MIARAALLLLIAIAVISLAGKWMRPKIAPKSKGTAIEAARKCRVCEAYVLGSDPAPCERPSCPFL